MLREWVEQHDLTSPDRLLFRTRNNTRPSGSNWARAWHRALESVGQKPMRFYDCRHAAATTWLRAGMPLGEQHDDSATASKHSSPPTSAPSTTKNMSPTNESTRSSGSETKTTSRSTTRTAAADTSKPEFDQRPVRRVSHDRRGAAVAGGAYAGSWRGMRRVDLIAFAAWRCRPDQRIGVRRRGTRRQPGSCCRSLGRR